ncbi:uncharacterized protein LOC119746222 [Patiria miniata]|uniref:THAP-type domain-containing protein n=1 Tax=Patiria miniata TaxID=46514 RepID=A0A914BS18_PATMI|nr:uncharacterized protein LOC119746222 [Patiria miniata]
MPKSNRNCAVGGCSHTQKTCPKGRFVGFPNEDRQPERRALWVKLVQRGSHWIPTKNSRVCSCHFSGGYKVDDPNDPAYNPSIFPPMPELDRRVRKTLMEEMCRRKAQEGHATIDMNFDLPFQPASSQTNDNNDFMTFVSTALDLSTEASEDFTQVVKSEPGVLISDAEQLVNGSKETVKSEALPRVTTTAEPTTGSNLSIGGPMTSSCQLTTGNRLPRDGPFSTSGNPGWVYINQSRPVGGAMNLTRDGHEPASKRRRLLLPHHKQQTPVRLQKFQSTNRKFTGNLSVAKNPRNSQMRHFSRAAGSVDLNRTRATDLSIASSERNATSVQPRNCILSNLLTNSRPKEVQTVLSVASQAEWNSLSAQTNSRCVGFHGWNDICFSRTTVLSVAGVSPEVFDLLLGHLPEVMPGLPAHNSLLLFLMKLKLNVPFEFLANVFGITAATALNIFTHVLSVMVTYLSDLIQWPSDTCKDPLPQESLRTCIPKVSLIIDCLIIQTELNQLELISQEIGTFAVKILVGLHPNGSVGSVSNAYSGCATNSDMLIHLRMPDSLEKDSHVLLLQHDRGLQQILTAKGFRVLAPPFSSRPVHGQKDPSTCSDFKEVPQRHTETVNELSKLLEPSELPAGTDPETVDGFLESVDGVLESVDGLLESVDGLPVVAEAPSSTAGPSSCPQPQGTVNTTASGIFAGKMAQRLRSFSILANMFESNLLPLIDDVVCVCAALNNLQEPIAVV